MCVNGKMKKLNSDRLEQIYIQFNRRAFVHPDPLEFLYLYDDLKDREIVAMIASALAYGRVAGILKSVGRVLGITGPSPYEYVINCDYETVRNDLDGFVHRFATGDSVAALLSGVSGVIKEYGSLYACFCEGIKKTDETILPALNHLVDRMLLNQHGRAGHLVALPAKGSACKRMNLFLRWMIRNDNVDPGGWDDIPSSKLIVPLDVHMHRISTALGLTSRKQGNMKTALEITSGFRRFCSDDPVKYDFALTRFGIRDDMHFDDFMNM